MLPTLAESAAQVTMIQRSPSYVLVEYNMSWFYKYLPLWLAFPIFRIYDVIFRYLVVLMCQYSPHTVRRFILKTTEKQLPAWIDPEVHFNPLCKQIVGYISNLEFQGTCQLQRN